MDTLTLRYGMDICLRNVGSQKYFGYVEDKGQNIKINVNSMPPYTQIAGKPPGVKRVSSTRFRLKSRSLANKDGDVICFGMTVMLYDIQTDSYLVCGTNNQTIGFNKFGLIEKDNEIITKLATLTFLDERNVRSNQPITIYDDVFMKTVMGNFMGYVKIGLGDVEVVASAVETSRETAWNLMKVDTPYIPEWVYHRPTFSKFIKPAEPEESFSQNKQQQLGLSNPSLQEMKLVEDILDVMLGFNGEYIKRDANWGFVIEPNKQRPTCNSALAELTKKILTLPAHYIQIQRYISANSIEQGTVCQALCSGLRYIIKDYKTMVNMFDLEVSQRGLTLQEIWYQIQEALQLMESIVELLKQANNKKGGQLISCILKMLNGSTSQQVVLIYTYLLDKCLRVYIQMISKWIYQGIIQDQFQEFMVFCQGDKEKSKNFKNRGRDQVWSCWEQKYTLRNNQIPSLFEKDSYIIFVTGKYLNIIKSCTQLQQHPLHKQIEKNLEKNIKNQDFTQVIMRAYDWANQKLQNLVLNEFRLEQVLRSLKGYYFLGFGDLFVHFMDSAQKDLESKSSKVEIGSSKPISVQKLQNLFDLLIRTSSANNDPYKEQISCRLQNSTLYEQVHKIKTIDFENLPSQKIFLKKESKNVDYFNLDFKCRFPLNLIINENSLSKYQALFRYLFWCKFIQRQLNGVWLDLQSTKGANIKFFKRANLLTQKMLNFIKGLIYYLSYQVIEKNWRNFQVNLTKIKNFEDIITYHNQFLAKCLTESLLINNSLLKIITCDLGGSCQSFITVKKYVSMFDANKIRTVIDPKRSILNQKIQKRKDIQKYFTEWVQQDEFENFVLTLNQNFDQNMKKLLRQVYTIVGKDEANSHLVSLLDTLDPKKYYNRHLFEESRSFIY